MGWVLLLIFVFGSYGHDCIHDQLLKNSGDIQIVEQEYLLPTKRGASENRFTQPLRIHLDMNNLHDDLFTCYKAGDSCKYFNSDAPCTCRAEDVLTSEKRALLNKFLREATVFYENMLSVMPLDPTWKLRVNSSLASAKYCDNIRFSPSYEAGIDAEYLLIVTSRPIQGQSVVATARYCQVDHYGAFGGRPVVGIMNIQPIHLVAGKQFEPSQVGVVIHEISHALGFSSAKFNSGFIRWTGPDTWVNVFSKDIKREYYHPGIKHKVTRIVTPGVQEAARIHFNCGTLDGAELEDAGGQGTAGSHWDKRVYQNEYMTGIQSPFPAYSNITLSLFKDMGWYGIRTEHTDVALVWGKNMGCDFCDKGCDMWPPTEQQEGYRCQKTSPREQCSWDLRGIGTCSSENPTPLDEPGCEYYSPNANSFCNEDTQILYFSLPSGEIYGPTSRCFHSSLVVAPKLAPFVFTPQPPYMHCYLTVCAGPKKLKVNPLHLPSPSVLGFS